MAGGAIDLHDLALPEVLDPPGTSGSIPASVPGVLTDLVNKRSRLIHAPLRLRLPMPT
jgi:hypothetical protein